MTRDLRGHMNCNNENSADELEDINGVIVGFGYGHNPHPLAVLFCVCAAESSYTLNHEGIVH